MEVEVIHTVLTEVLQELKEIKQQRGELTTPLLEMKDKVDGVEKQLGGQSASAKLVDGSSIIRSIDEGFDRMKSAVDTPPKTTIKQWRILLFPEYNAGEYYKIVFGRLLFWMMGFLVVTHLFVLGKKGVEGHFRIREIEAETWQYKEAWNYFYRNSAKGVRRKMDSVWRRER